MEFSIDPGPAVEGFSFARQGQPVNMGVGIKT